MKKILLLFITLLVSANLAAQDSSFVSISVGNKYVFKGSYKYHGGHSGFLKGFTTTVLKDTVINTETYFIAEQEGFYYTDIFPFLVNSEQDTSYKYLIKSGLNTFGYYNLSGDTIFVFNKNTGVAISDTLKELYGGKSSKEVLGLELDEWHIYTDGPFLRHDVNGIAIANKFGLTNIFNVIGGGFQNFNLAAAIIDGKVFGDSTQVSNELYSDAPININLFQNYPNPFNPNTRIEISLPYSSSILLEVFDSAGRRIATLFKGSKVAGLHTFNFEGQGLASGIYLYKLEVNGQVQVKKMTLIK